MVKMKPFMGQMPFFNNKDINYCQMKKISFFPKQEVTYQWMTSSSDIGTIPIPTSGSGSLYREKDLLGIYY